MQDKDHSVKPSTEPSTSHKAQPNVNEVQILTLIKSSKSTHATLINNPPSNPPKPVKPTRKRRTILSAAEEYLHMWPLKIRIRRNELKHRKTFLNENFQNEYGKQWDREKRPVMGKVEPKEGGGFGSTYEQHPDSAE